MLSLINNCKKRTFMLKSCWKHKFQIKQWWSSSILWWSIKQQQVLLAILGLRVIPKQSSVNSNLFVMRISSCFGETIFRRTWSQANKQADRDRSFIYMCVCYVHVIYILRSDFCVYIYIYIYIYEEKIADHR